MIMRVGGNSSHHKFGTLAMHGVAKKKFSNSPILFMNWRRMASLKALAALCIAYSSSTFELAMQNVAIGY